MTELERDVVIVGSGAGGGTVAAELSPLARAGRRILVLERGPRLHAGEFTGRELPMARTLYADSGGFLTREGTLTLAFARTYGGSTAVYTGTSLVAPERVIRDWDVPGIEHADLVRRSERHAREVGVHPLPPEEINENNRLFVRGCERAGLRAEQFPLNVRGCLGSSLCNLGCPNRAKQGTDVVQLPAAEAAGVEVATRAEVERIEERAVIVRVRPRPAGGAGADPEWSPGRYRVRAPVIVAAGGTMGSPVLLLRSGFGRDLPRLGRGFTCHPALILVAEHPRPIGNDLGHPKSYYLDRAAEEGFVLETCMYFPFVTAKSLTGFGPEHSRFLRAFPRLQMILALACDRAEAGNRVEVDRRGGPRVRYRFTDAVRESFARACRTATRIFLAAGARRVHAPLADPPVVEPGEAAPLEERIRADFFVPGRTSVSAAHLMGGCAMGRTAADSVVDHRGRVHGRPWLRVADASLFPDALQINPYLTIMALADRVAEGIRDEIGDLTAAGRSS